MKASFTLTAVFEEVSGGGYKAFIEEIPGVSSKGATLEEAKFNLSEALELILDTQRMLSELELKNKKVIREQLELA